LPSNRINSPIISILSKRRAFGEAHNRLCKKYAGKPVVTIGYGPDFAVLRSKAVKMNISQMVKELMEEMPTAVSPEAGTWWWDRSSSWAA